MNDNKKNEKDKSSEKTAVVSDEDTKKETNNDQKDSNTTPETSEIKEKSEDQKTQDVKVDMKPKTEDKKKDSKEDVKEKKLKDEDNEKLNEKKKDNKQPKDKKAAVEKTPENNKSKNDIKKVEIPQENSATLKDAPDNAKWYVVHTYSGHENKVATNLKQRIETMKLEEQIFDIIVPTRNIVTVKHGKKEEQKEKIFPGYILVRMILGDQSWLAVRTTQGVTAFVGAGNKPTPISESEVATILKFMQMEAPKYKTSFSMGEAVKIVDGPFSDFLGTIDTIDEEKGKVKVLVSIFGRETPVELDFLQISKL
ncbi:transcription termination/antitermination protein NusG [Patescibacteria group bacterium]